MKATPGAAAVTQQRRRTRAGSKLSMSGAAAHVERRQLIGCIADAVAQHAQVVGAAGRNASSIGGGCSERQVGLGRYRSAAAALSTALRRGRRMLGRPLSTRSTVAVETPMAVAISMIRLRVAIIPIKHISFTARPPAIALSLVTARVLYQNHQQNGQIAPARPDATTSAGTMEAVAGRSKET
jgi:hypothetical protein